MTPRPTIDLSIPLSMLEMDRRARQEACAQVKDALGDNYVVEKLALVHGLMSFHEDAGSIPRIQNLFMEASGSKRLHVQVSFLTPDKGEEWVDLEDGNLYAEQVAKRARQVGVEISPEDTRRLLAAVQHLTSIKSLGLHDVIRLVAQGMGSSEVILSMDQVASPSSLIFSERAGLIAAFEDAQKMEARLPPANPDLPLRRPGL